MNGSVILRALTVLLAAFVFSGCYEREPVCDLSGGRSAVRFRIDSAGVLHMMPADLGRIRLSLYDSDTGKEVYNTFLDPSGGYLYAVRPGAYKVAAWSMNSEFTSVTYTDRYDLLTAESRVIQSTPVCVTAAPDHVFACSCEEIVIPGAGAGDGAAVTLALKSVIETWRIEVEGVRGLGNFSGATFLIDNQVRELYFRQWRRSGTAVDKAFGTVGEGNLVVGEFGTFGMPEDGKVSVVVAIAAGNGSVHKRTFDVTDQVRDPGNDSHIIRIVFDTELRAPEQGGLQPSAEDWNENVDVIGLV